MLRISRLAFLFGFLAIMVLGTGCIKRSNGETTFIYNAKEQPRGGYPGAIVRPNRLERPATTVEGQCGDCRVSGGTCPACRALGVQGTHYCDHCHEASVFCDPCRKAGE